MRKIKKEQFPYASFNKLGLSTSMIEDLPESVMEDLMEGRRSPLLPLQLNAADGSKVTYYARLQLVENKDKKASLACYMINKSVELSQFNEEEQAQLKKGKVVSTDIEIGNQSKIHSYVQIDDNNQVLSAPTQLVARNINNLASEHNFRTSEISSLLKGEVVTFVDDDTPLSVGIDLRESSGLRCSYGDEREWHLQSNSKLERFNFGLEGCWTLEEDGTMNYVPQDQYTEEMTTAFNKRIESFSRGMK